MSKKEKLLKRFLSIPHPTDFRWDELVTMLSGLGFDAFESTGGSSHKHFVHRGNADWAIVQARPHPSGILKIYQIKQVTEFLREKGLIE